MFIFSLFLFFLILPMILVLEQASVAESATEAPIPLHEKSVVRFADAKQGKEILTKRDRFIKVLSPFDRQARLKTEKTVDEAEFLQFIGEQATDWKDEEREKLARAVQIIRKRFENLRDLFPPVVWLVKTTGKEEGNAAYCRTNAIVLPMRMLTREPKDLERLLTHELFHILSTHNPALREKLYALLGFQPTGKKIELPVALRDRKLTNPDAPIIEHAIELEHDGEKIMAAPMLYSSTEKYDPERGGSFFQYLQFKLMALEQADESANETSNGNWRPVMKDGQPVFLDPANTSSYHRQIGRNTRYIIHPDEILADNFVHLIMGTQDLLSPEIVRKMKTLLFKD